MWVSKADCSMVDIQCKILKRAVLWTFTGWGNFLIQDNFPESEWLILKEEPALILMYKLFSCGLFVVFPQSVTKTVNFLSFKYIFVLSITFDWFVCESYYSGKDLMLKYESKLSFQAMTLLPCFFLTFSTHYMIQGVLCHLENTLYP